jgi:sialate O-acetylesterase
MTARSSLSLTVILALAIAAGSAAPAGAAIRLPAVFGDHMVVQQGKPVVVWGWASPREGITVRFAGQEASTAAGADGRWQAVLHAVNAGGGPLELAVAGTNGAPIVLKDVLAGEVWLCSGQSNMEFWLASTFSSSPEVLRADDPMIRLFNVPKRTSAAPLSDVEAKWTPCTPKTAASFSAIAYYFGREIHDRLGVPVGLIESAWGGTDIEPWTPPAGFAAVPETKPYLAAAGKSMAAYRTALAKTMPAWDSWVRDTRTALAGAGTIPAKPVEPDNPFDSPQTPTALYNGMIHPLVPFAIRGAIWYQGENNRNDCLAYEKKMEALIRGWRTVWEEGDFPFYYVQIAPYYYSYNREIPDGDVPDFLRLPLLWEAQTNALRLPNTGMAVITDITELMDIHPRNKKEVGRRLALLARAKTYGETGLVCSGPLYKSMAVEDGKIRVSFDSVGSGLMIGDGPGLRWFEIAGDDHIFYKATAEIDGSTVVVRSPRVAAPRAVRFGWHQMAVPNLFNKDGLPAAPFRTDRW